MAKTKDGALKPHMNLDKNTATKAFMQNPCKILVKKNKIAVSQSNSRIFLINNYFKIYVKDFQGQQPIGYTVSWSLKKV